MKSIFLKQFLLVFSLLSIAFLSFSQKKEKPNILFILTDDLGIGDIGVYYQNKLKAANKPHIQTPGLDKLAAEGAMLTHNYCNAPVCAPSRASFLSGLTQGHANVRNNQFDKALEDNHNVASILKQTGYKTFIIGKWGLQGGQEKLDGLQYWNAYPLNRGFDYFFGYVRHRDGHEHYPKEGPAVGKREVYEGRINIADDLDKCYTGDLFTAVAKKCIADQVKKNPGQPFFMFLSFDTPHATTQVPTQEYPEGKGLNGGIQYIGTPGKYINTASGEIDSWIDPRVANATYDHDNDPATPEIAWPNVYKRYATMVQRIDRQVDDVLQLLKDLNIDKNTLVVFTSDNGVSNESYIKEPFHPTFFKSFNGFDGLKRDVWEGGIRVPAFVKWNGKIPAGKINNTPSMTSDWLNTFLDAAGLPLLARSNGVSLMPSLQGRENQKESSVYVEYESPSETPAYADFEKKRQNRIRNQVQAIRIGDYIGVRYNIQSQADNFEIYDVVNDPKQVHDLATSKPFFIALQQQMKDKALQSRRPDSTAPRPYDKELVPAISKGVDRRIQWEFYPGNFTRVPAGDNLKRKSKGSSKSISAKIKTGNQKGVIVLKGTINIPTDGEYNFRMKAADKAIFKLHDILLIDEDYHYSPGGEKSEKILLKAGLHPFRLYYKNVPGSRQDIDLQWEKL